jgi:hypothetical protein
MSDRGLDAEAVQRGAEDVVVVESVHQPRIPARFRRGRSVDHALIEVGCPDSPRAAGEVDVVAVVDLGEVVERSRQLGERQPVAPPVVLDVDVALLDIDVRRPVLSHRPQLHEVAVGGVLVHRKEKIQRADYIVVLREDRMFAIDHRVRRCSLLCEVNDGVGSMVGDDPVEKLPVKQVTDLERDLAA